VSCIGKWYFGITRRFDAPNALLSNGLFWPLKPGSVREIAKLLTKELLEKIELFKPIKRFFE